MTMLTDTINEISFLGNGYLAKRYNNESACFNEYSGARLFAKCAGPFVPKIYKKSPELCLISEISEAKSAFDLLNEGGLSMNQVSVFIADFIGKTAINIKSKEKFVVNKLKYLEQLKKTQSKFYQNKDILLSFLSKNTLAYVENSLELISAEAYISQMTVLHRDLHLSNVLVDSSGSMYIIDFEQAAYGPIELEFQNSLFFNDAKSLDVAQIVSLLRYKYSVSYSEKNENLFKFAYITEQLNQAIEMGLVEKTKFIAYKLESAIGI